MKITTTEELMKKIEKIKEAQKIYSTYSQEQVDKIFKAAAIAANKERIKLAKIAVEETALDNSSVGSSIHPIISFGAP
ncbi:hypothetical protein, partial [Clostridium sp. L74]|uniref:hypothetical protein n=1 Tax=Clostridium sp. L74 TaxID=1560217 RepID=UPI0006ABA505